MFWLLGFECMGAWRPLSLQLGARYVEAWLRLMWRVHGGLGEAWRPLEAPSEPIQKSDQFKTPNPEPSSILAGLNAVGRFLEAPETGVFSIRSKSKSGK